MKLSNLLSCAIPQSNVENQRFDIKQEQAKEKQLQLKQQEERVLELKLGSRPQIPYNTNRLLNLIPIKLMEQYCTIPCSDDNLDIRKIVPMDDVEVQLRKKIKG